MLQNPSQRSSSRRRKLNHQSGFTLMELMTVVVIIGVLSSVAIPSIRGFIHRSREAEAPTNIMAIAQGAKLFFNQERVDSKGIVVPPQFPSSRNSRNKVDGYATMPNVTPCQDIKGSPLYAKNSKRWFKDRLNEPWFDLKFSLSRSHYFQYGYVTRNSGRSATYTIRARGDLDCNKKLKTFLFKARVDRTSGEIIPGEIVAFSSTATQTKPSDPIRETRPSDPIRGKKPPTGPNRGIKPPTGPIRERVIERVKRFPGGMEPQ